MELVYQASSHARVPAWEEIGKVPHISEMYVFSAYLSEYKRKRRDRVFFVYIVSTREP